MTLSRLSVLALAASLITTSGAWAEPRPVPPASLAGAIAAPELAACDQPASAKAIADSGADRLDAMRTRMMDQAKYATTLTLWKTARLQELKVWTQDDATAFSRSLMADEAFQKANADSLEAGTKLMTRANELTDVIDGGADAAAYKALVELLNGGKALEVLVARQWAIIDARFDAAAKAGGVSLD